MPSPVTTVNTTGSTVEQQLLQLQLEIAYLRGKLDAQEANSKHVESKPNTDFLSQIFTIKMLNSI